MNATEAEKQIREAVKWLASNGMAVHALDTCQELEISLLRSVCLDKPFKSSYGAKKDWDWGNAKDLIDELSDIGRGMPPKWRECLFDKIAERIVKRHD